MARKFKDAYNNVGRSKEVRFEKPIGPSQTVPGEVMSIKDIMIRAQAGNEPEYKETQYFDPVEIEYIDKYFGPHHDLTDLEALNKKANELREAVKNAQERKATQEAEEKVLGSETGEEDAKEGGE